MCICVCVCNKYFFSKIHFIMATAYSRSGEDEENERSSKFLIADCVGGGGYYSFSSLIV